MKSATVYLQEQRVILDQEDHLERMVKMDKEAHRAPLECQWVIVVGHIVWIHLTEEYLQSAPLKWESELHKYFKGPGL